MKKLLVLVPLLLLLTGCAATTATSTASTLAATPTPTTIEQGIEAVQTAAAALPADQTDKLYLAGVRATIPDKSDEELKAAGHTFCDNKAKGLAGGDLVASINALGFTAAQSWAVMMSAGMIYCAPK